MYCWFIEFSNRVDCGVYSRECIFINRQTSNYREARDCHDLDRVGMSNPYFPVDNGLEQILQSLSTITSHLCALEKAVFSGSNVDQETGSKDVADKSKSRWNFWGFIRWLVQERGTLLTIAILLRKQSSEGHGCSEVLATVYNLLGVAKPPVASVELWSQMQESTIRRGI